jgi:hypothetical protein
VAVNKQNKNLDIIKFKLGLQITKVLEEIKMFFNLYRLVAIIEAF